MKLSDLYRIGSVYNWKDPKDSKLDINGKKSQHDAAPMSSIVYAKYDNNLTNSDNSGEYTNPDPLSFVNDNTDDNYSELHNETESNTATALGIAPDLNIRKKVSNSGHTETPQRSRQVRGKHGLALPLRSGNQTTPPSKIRHRKFMGMPDNLGHGI